MTKRIILVDGDIVAFRAAAANETRSIRATHKTTGQVICCPHRTALKEQIKDVFEINEFDIEDVQTPEDVSHAFNAIKTTINALKKSCNAEAVEVFLSGENNFRDNLPLPTKYKSAREGLNKPLLLSECRDYLKRKYKAVIANNKEADDELTIRAYDLASKGHIGIVCTLDKDANGTAVWLYNWNNMTEPVKVSGLGYVELDDEKVLRGYGRKFYYAQWVKGDSVDNFKPSEVAKKKFGDVGCYNLLKDCKTDKECVQAVYNQYKEWYPVEPIEYTDWQGNKQSMTRIQFMDMYAAACHMKRFEDDVFDTEKLLTTLKIER